MKNSRNYYLVGPMGSGKSTVGKKLAQTLNNGFFDSDKEIETKTGVTVAHIFDVEGEQGFRKRETDILRELVQKKNIILATGGGSILSSVNRDLLCENGVVIYLKTSVDTILDRTCSDRNRPLLQTGDPRKKLEELMQIRIPLYTQVADYSIDTDNQTVNNVAATILKNVCY